MAITLVSNSPTTKVLSTCNSPTPKIFDHECPNDNYSADDIAQATIAQTTNAPMTIAPATVATLNKKRQLLR